jgi:uncharacterized protein YecE (DUF72 family)
MTTSQKHTQRSRTQKPAIRVGIGGWTYAPWRNNFYPEGLAHAKELEYASHQVTAIEVNGTFYGLQKPSTFARWRDAVPDDFVFSLKAPRYATHRTTLADAGEAIDRFVDSGFVELGDKLGPLLWQLPPRKKFDADDIVAFVELLPATIDGRPLRHVLEVRHPSFVTEDYLRIARSHGVATVFTDSTEYPSFADVTGELIYARLVRSDAKLVAGYAPAALDAWQRRALLWAGGGMPTDLPCIAPPTETAHPRDVFIYFINGAKERAPAAARALLERLQDGHA